MAFRMPEQVTPRNAENEVFYRIDPACCLNEEVHSGCLVLQVPHRNLFVRAMHFAFVDLMGCS